MATQGGAMKITLYYSWVLPWRELEQCFIGPGILNLGNKIYMGLGLLFFEFGIVLERKVINEPDS
jgi:hypothetical protein